MNDSRLGSAIRKRKDMYMIVGLQVARSAIVYHLLDNTKGGGAKGGVPIAMTGAEIAGHLDLTIESLDSGDSTERIIVLQESHPWWLYYTPALGILVYAWIIHYLVAKVI